MFYLSEKYEVVFYLRFKITIVSTFQETTECTDEAGKVLKPSNDNPFIESSQQPNVVDMRGNNHFSFTRDNAFA